MLRGSTLKQYYDMNIQQHPGISTANYTPILYLKDKYTLVDEGVEWLRSRYEKTNTKSLSWAVLEVKDSGKRFIAVNMHGAFWSTNYDLPGGETQSSMSVKVLHWRVDNVNQMLERIDKLKVKSGDLPVVATGDFNSDASTDAYKTAVSGGLLSSQDTAAVSATNGVRSHHAVGSAPASGANIDHVFYNEAGFESLKFVIGTREDDLKAADHCPVYADLKFK